MRRVLILPLAVLALALAGAPGRADDKAALAEDEKKLKDCHLATDGPSLVAFLKTRAKSEVTRAELEALLKGLEDADLGKRQKAAGELVSIGTLAIPMLRMAAREIDTPDLSFQAKACLKAIEEDPGALTVAVVRLLAARKAAGAAQALLDFLPHAETDAVLDELKNVLAGVAYEKGKADPLLLKALSDKHPLRRATAITALCQGGIPEPRAVFRKLLSDPKPSVRLRASLALASASDPKAVSTLITLLPELPMEQVKEIEGFLQELAGDLAPKVEITADTLGREKARDAWARWWLDTEGPGLINELARRTLSEDDLAKITALIEKLGDDNFDSRQEAEESLKKLGTKILPLLRNARGNPDLEVRNRAAKTADAIDMDKDKVPPLSVITARLMALRKPRGGAEAIIAYMPFADDESMAEELQTALNAMAYDGGKANPALLKGIKDAKNPSRRAAAAQALCAGPLGEYMKEIRLALADKDPNVRARTALALASAKEPEAVPVLIKLLEDGPVDWVGPAEEYLVKLGRDAGPKELPEGDENRKKRAAAWSKWWDDSKGKVDMVDRHAPTTRVPYLGHTILIQANNGQIQELDKDQKVRWTMTGLLQPWDCVPLPGGKYLISEYNGQRVTERDKDGKVYWEKKIPSWPISAERLRNGRTFITCRNLLLEVDKSGKELWKHERPHDIYSARRLPGGDVVIVTQNRQVIRLDRNGKEKSTYMVPLVTSHQNEILDNGNVLMPLNWQNKVVEYDPKGKEVWSSGTVMQPSHAMRLPNGNTLIASQNWPNKVVEVKKDGKQVNELTTNTYVFRARRR